jgi:lipid-A-disaccharide synthase
MPNYDIVLVANSPGELSAMVKPTAEAIAQSIKAVRIILVLTPCQYSSGKEIEYLKGIKEIQTIIPAADYKKWIMLNQKPKINFSEKGVVLYLGGDLAHAMLVARKLKFPAFAYVQERIAWKKFYQLFFVPDEDTYKKWAKDPVLNKKIKVIGNLMTDSVSGQKSWSPEKNVITFMPGSRAWQIQYMTNLYEKIMIAMKTEMPALKFQVVTSPFESAKPIGNAKIISFAEAFNSELVITIPGTNTARLAARGIPMLVVFPLDKVEVIPLEGAAHYIGMLPYFGKKFKKLFAHILNQNTKFFALPNIKAGQEIVPEIRGKVEPAKVAEAALSLLNNLDQRKKMSKELFQSMGKTGAAKKIAEEINEALRSFT